MRRRFEFRLARVQQIRSVQEQVARNNWAAAEALATQRAAECDEVRAAMLATEAALAEARAPAADGRSRPLDAREDLVQEQLLERHRALLTRRLEVLQRARTDADRLRDTWRTAQGDARALEELGQRARQEHVREFAKLEAAEADERALARFRERFSAATPETDTHPADLPPVG